jgi:hypothetical protein
MYSIPYQRMDAFEEKIQECPVRVHDTGFKVLVHVY